MSENRKRYTEAELRRNMAMKANGDEYTTPEWLEGNRRLAESLKAEAAAKKAKAKTKAKVKKAK